MSGFALGQPVPNRLPVQRRGESMRVVTVPVVSASVSTGRLDQAASFTPGHVVVPLTRMRLTRTRTTAAPAPLLPPPLGNVHHDGSSAGAGGADVPLLLTISVWSAFEPPSQSTKPRLDGSSSKRQHAPHEPPQFGVWPSRSTPITTGDVKIRSARPSTSGAPAASCSGPDVNAPFEPLHTVPGTPPVGLPCVLRNEPVDASDGQYAFAPVATVNDIAPSGPTVGVGVTTGVGVGAPGVGVGPPGVCVGVATGVAVGCGVAVGALTGTVQNAVTSTRWPSLAAVRPPTPG